MGDIVRTDAEILMAISRANPNPEAALRLQTQVLRDLYVTLVARASTGTSDLADLTTLVGQRTVVSVKEFGAVGDGETDDTEAFQDAIDNVWAAVLGANDRKVGGIVFVPVGEYMITNIKMRTRVGLVGASRTGTILTHDDSGGHTGAMINVFNSASNHIDLRNFTLNGAGDSTLNGIDFTNSDDDAVINADTIFDVGDCNHRFSDLDILNFTDGWGITLTGPRATFARDIHISHCENGFFIGCSDGKYVNLDVNWIGQRGIVINGGNNKILNSKVWYIGTDAAYATGDGLVINSSRNDVVAFEAQDISRHGVLIDGGDNNRVQAQLDNIGNFFSMQSQGIEHPSGTIVSAVRLEGTATYNRVDATLAQRSPSSDLHAVASFGHEATDNYVSLMRNPDHLLAAGEDVHFDRGTATNNVVEINGVQPNYVVSSIAASADDASENTSTNAVTITTTGSNINDTRDQGLRFEVPDLPQGATIVTARIQFSSSGAGSDDVDAVIAGEDADAAVAYTTGASDISNRVATTATVAWDNIPAWTTGQRDADTLTPELKTIVQEIVDRASFGGVLAFIITSATASPAARPIGTFDNTSVHEATLIVRYTA